MKTLSLFILTSFFYILGISTLSAANWKVYVAKYKQDKTCAITYTFDDGLAEHSTVAAPEAKWIKICSTWNLLHYSHHADKPMVLPQTVL